MDFTSLSAGLLRENVIVFNNEYPQFKILGVNVNRWKYIIEAYFLGLSVKDMRIIADFNDDKFPIYGLGHQEKAAIAFAFMSRGLNIKYLKAFAGEYFHTREYEVFFNILKSELSFDIKNLLVSVRDDKKAEVFEKFKEGMTIDEFKIGQRLGVL
jgi:hypothetical protein